MARLFTLLMLGTATYTVMTWGVPRAAPSGDGTTSQAVLAIPPLDLMSLGVGLVAGVAIGWIWALPWRNMSELFREVMVRSIRGFGFVGLAMAAAAVILFY